jgi:hypothetical protein
VPAADRPVRPEWLIGRVEIAELGHGEHWRFTRREAVSPLARAVVRGLRRRVGRWRSPG